MQQEGYQQQPMQQPIMYEDTTPLGIGSYIAMMLLQAVPVVGIILMFVWGFGSNVNVNKKNFARASLILLGISIVLTLITMAIMGKTFSSIAFADVK